VEEVLLDGEEFEYLLQRLRLLERKIATLEGKVKELGGDDDDDDDDG